MEIQFFFLNQTHFLQKEISNHFLLLFTRNFVVLVQITHSNLQEFEYF